MQRLTLLTCGCLLAAIAHADDSPVPAHPGPNRPDEPLRKAFSLAAAAEVLDASSADWWQSR